MEYYRIKLSLDKIFYDSLRRNYYREILLICVAPMGGKYKYI